jgi:uncharacterized protein (DUF58 family)
VLLRLAPGERAVVELRPRGLRRGRFVAQTLRVSTRFPFGLAEKSRDFALSQVLYVYPRAVPGAAPPPGRPRREGERALPRAGLGPELHSLRPLAPRDALSTIHWRKSAQGLGWVVSVRQAELERELELSADLRSAPEPEALARLEARLEQVAAAAEQALSQGAAVALRLGGRRLPFGAGPSHRRVLLRAIAEAQPELEVGR